MIGFRKVFAPGNRGILLDVVVLIVNLTLMRILTRLSLNLVNEAETDVPAKISLGLFFAGLLFLQPLGPVLKRWSFHQRYKSSELSEFAGCLPLLLIVPYIIMMMIISLMASLYFLEAFRDSALQGISTLVLLGGIVLSFVNAVIIFRYFLRPRKAPRWKFLTTPQSEWLGDICMLLNVICFQVLWSAYTSSAIFWESLDTTSHGKPPGFFEGILARFILVGLIALILYFPPRIFYLVIDRHRKITWLTILLANLPLIFGVVFFSHAAAGARPANATAAAPAPAKGMVLGKSSFIVTAEDFYKEYRPDSQASAKKYAGKYVTVTGRVQSVEMNKGNPLGSAVRLNGGGVVRWVICRFDDDQEETMQTLKRDQEVTLQGIGEPFWIGGPSLKHCVLVGRQ